MPARPPLTTLLRVATRDSRRGACKPHGEKVARNSKHTLQACSSRWICLLTYIPPSFSGLFIITHEEAFSYHFSGRILRFRENSPFRCFIRTRQAFFTPAHNRYTPVGLNPPGYAPHHTRSDGSGAQYLEWCAAHPAE